MSLIEDIKDWYKDETYPPDTSEFELVSQEDVSEARWGTHFVNVYHREGEYVAVADVRPATEMQDWGDYGEPDIYPVEPKTETKVVTTYVAL